MNATAIDKRKSSARKRATPVKRFAVFSGDRWSIGASSSVARSLARSLAKKIKPAKRRPSEKLVAAARDYILDAYDLAAALLTESEREDLIATLREDLDLRQSEIAHAIEARRNKRTARKAA